MTLSAVAIDAIAPGLIDTPIIGHLSEERRAALAKLQPGRRLGQSDDIAEVVVYLASPAAGFVAGQTIIVDGGKSVGGAWM